MSSFHAAYYNKEQEILERRQTLIDWYLRLTNARRQRADKNEGELISRQAGMSIIRD